MGSNPDQSFTTPLQFREGTFFLGGEDWGLREEGHSSKGGGVGELGVF